ncbi:hypothetical protein TIFTF001_014313 [Ficus carica]|uniref:Uncharacterized protein n=1 Tax=Ficus carica TaxID=3494 RepID=A0AA88A3J8_FICCA|nr:hypothetical protein TIFTF001_014313 [Ficus carica]
MFLGSFLDDGFRHKLAGFVSEWLHDMETIFGLCHIGVHLQVMLASRRLVEGTRLWWLSLEDLEIPKNVWMNFRAPIILRYGPLLGEGPHYQDPDIYRDMFRDAMLPYVPLDIERPMMQALHILSDGLPPEVRQFTPPPTIEMTLDEMIDTIMGRMPMTQEEDVDVDADVEMDPANPGEYPKDPPVIIITSDDEE